LQADVKATATSAEQIQRIRSMQDLTEDDDHTTV
jgi:hypothetical protein